MVERQFDRATGRNLQRRIRIRKDGHREEFSLFIRVYTVEELAGMLRKAGLTIKKMYGSHNADPLSADSLRCIVVADKS